MELLLRVDACFEIRSRGVVAEPRLPLERVSGRAFRAVLRLPDGTEREVDAIIEIAHVHSPEVPPEKRAWGALVLKGLTKAEVPVGTEVYVA